MADPTATSTGGSEGVPDALVQATAAFLLTGFTQVGIQQLSIHAGDSVVQARGANETYQIANARAQKAFLAPTNEDAEAIVTMRSGNDVALALSQLNSAIANGGQQSKMLWQTVPEGALAATGAAK